MYTHTTRVVPSTKYLVEGRGRCVPIDYQLPSTLVLPRGRGRCTYTILGRGSDMGRCTHSLLGYYYYQVERGGRDTPSTMGVVPSTPTPMVYHLVPYP